MTKEQEIQAAIVVFPDMIAIASPEINSATELACYELNKFVDYLKTLVPELERHEAIMVAAAVLTSLPIWFEDNPDIVDAIKVDCQAIITNRK